MDQQIPPEWAHLFEGKSHDEILGTPQPDDLSPMDRTRFEQAVYAAADAAVRAGLRANKERRALEELAILPPQPDNSGTEPLRFQAPPFPPLVIPEASTD